MELSGATHSHEGVDGISFAATLLGKEQQPRPFLYREFPAYGGQQSVRIADWKAIRQKLTNTQVRTELYNLKVDPAESRDVAAENADVVARLEALMKNEHEPSVLFPLPGIDRR